MSDDWIRVGRGNPPCPICHHKSWCTVSGDGAVVKCMRVAEGAYKHRTDNSGVAHFHRIGESKPRPYSPSMTKREKARINEPDFDAEGVMLQLADSCSGAVLAGMARGLGVSTDSLKALGVGYCHEKNAAAFPMWSARKTVIGIRYRTATGKKFAHTGSRNGLFIPDLVGRTGPIFAPEGPTDTAALWDWGVITIGRPNVSARMDLLVELARRWRRSVVVIGERDGGEGFKKPPILARQLRRKGVDTTYLYPPEGFKDVRKWKQDGGATEQDFLELVKERRT